ncbi:MAG: serine hydrolase, partial [Bacteroidetes bacterium]
MEENKKDEEIDCLFATALNNKVFPGAAFAFSIREGGAYKRIIKAYGYAQTEPEKKVLTLDAFFDLASLTKPLTTVPLILSFFDKKRITPESTLQDLLDYCPSDKAEINVHQLLSHSAGFPAHREYFNALRQLPEKEKKKYLLKLILEEPLVSSPGKIHLYSDIGFMLLGLIIEKISAESLDVLATDLIYRPLELENDLFFPALNNIETNYASTVKCPWSGKMLSGIVHDDNCRSLGGVAGHAGLFGTIAGVLSICELFLDQWLEKENFHPKYSNRLLQRTLMPVGDSGSTMGFDMISEKGSSSGKYFSKKSVGHLGFTGTSFWIDPVKGCIAVLLTNRVHPNAENWKI